MSIKFQYIADHSCDDGYVECESCYATAPVYLFSGKTYFHERPDRYLCQFCASTSIGDKTYTKGRPFDRESARDKELYQTMAKLANLLLDEITGRRNQLPTAQTPD